MSSAGEKNASTIISITSADIEHRGEIEIDLNNTNPNPVSGQPTMLWLSLERDATVGNTNDTYLGSVSLIQLSVPYVSWCTGGHLDSF